MMSDHGQQPNRVNDVSATLARIDERTRALVEDIRELKGNVITKGEFEARLRPVQMIVYGLVALILVAVVGLILANAGIKP